MILWWGALNTLKGCSVAEHMLCKKKVSGLSLSIFPWRLSGIKMEKDLLPLKVDSAELEEPLVWRCRATPHVILMFLKVIVTNARWQLRKIEHVILNVMKKMCWFFRSFILALLILKFNCAGLVYWKALLDVIDCNIWLTERQKQQTLVIWAVLDAGLCFFLFIWRLFLWDTKSDNVGNYFFSKLHI